MLPYLTFAFYRFSGGVGDATLPNFRILSFFR